MRRAGASRPSANRITLLRDADGDGVPEMREIFLEGLSQPFGMALVGDTFYVGNTDSVVAFPYVEGQTRITAPGRKLIDLKPGGHWTRNLLASKDGTKLYIGVGSVGNIGEEGMAAEENRAAILELDLATNQSRVFASGLRNPVGMAWEPVRWHALDRGQRTRWAGRRNPARLPDLGARWRLLWLALFAIGARRWTTACPQNPALVANAITPDYALGGHTASLGLCWLPEGTLPGIPGRHGHRPARLVEPQHAQRLQGRPGAFRKWPPGRHAVRTADRIPRPR